jgi:hypothetical protein
VDEINKAFTYVENHNSMDVGTPKAYPVKEKLDEAMNKTNELVKLKAKIHMANSTMWEKIFLLSELKSMVAKIKYVSTIEKPASPNGLREAVTAEITLAEKDVIIKNLEVQIEAIQEELDAHNYSTMIN